MNTDEIEDLKGKIVLEVSRYYCMYFPGRENFSINVFFDLTGKTSGRAVVADGKRMIRVNLTTAVNNSESYLSQTVPHEVAHIIDFDETGKMNHGDNWKRIMIRLGKSPIRCSNYEIKSISAKSPYLVKCSKCELTFTCSERVYSSLNQRHCVKCGGKTFETLESPYDEA